jgi:hypothetical protein
MANKTLYVRDSEIPLWDTAQAELGQSISALFSEFLREKVPMIKAFVHVLRSAPQSQELVVMFAPVETPEGAGAVEPQYVQEPDLGEFLESRGVAHDVSSKIVLELKGARSVSELTTIIKRRKGMSERFQARTQYGDWKGTAAADEFGGGADALSELFEATGKVDPDNEVMVGLEFYCGEGFFQCNGYFHPAPDEDGSGYYPSLKAKFLRDQINPIRVKKVSVDVSLEEFFNLFKRFNVVLVAGAIGIIGREFEVVENKY